MKKELTQVNKLKETLSEWEERNKTTTSKLEQLVHEIGREAILAELSAISRQLKQPF